MTTRLCMKHRILHDGGCAQCKAERQARKTEAYGNTEYRRNRARMLNPGARCQKCGTRDDLTVDHIVPASLGGTGHRTNLRVLCRTCNSRRGGFLTA